MFTDLSNEEKNMESLAAEMAKQKSERDRPRLKKLFRATFKPRRNCVIANGDGAVRELVEQIPLLGDIEFVSNLATAILYK